MRIVWEVLWGKTAQVDRPDICQELLAPYKHPQVRESVVVDDMRTDSVFDVSVTM